MSARQAAPSADAPVATGALREHEAALYLGVSVFTLRKWRAGNRGPKYVKFAGAERKGRGTAGRVLYRGRDLEAYLEECTVQTDTAPMPA